MLSPVPVSIVMTFYNGERFFREALDSILAQTYSDFELILINDGSTDGSLGIAQEYADKDPRIRLFSQKNHGISETANRGLKLAKNEWILRMDCDDVMHPQLLEKQIAFVQKNPDLAVAACNVLYINAKGQVIGKSRSRYESREAVHVDYAANKVIGFSQPGVMMRRSVILALGGYRKEFLSAHDVDLWNRLLESGAMVLVQPEFLIRYRIHGGSICVSQLLSTIWQTAWIKASILARRSGQPEPTLEEYIAQQNTQPFLKRIAWNCELYGGVFYKKAVVHLADGNKIRACLSMGLSCLLYPKLIYRKIKAKRIAFT